MWTVKRNCDKTKIRNRDVKHALQHLELPVIVKEIRNKAKIDKYITEKSNKLSMDGKKIFSHLWWNFDVRQTGGDTRSAKKRILK